ncbi:hypothetical protein NXW89_19270 [Bacteroides thetaiotaomicron]|nr:hypothetical protein [Bacteroides thetaiotaomicron]
MVEAIQQAEIDQVEAKYDVLIQEAENNGKILSLWKKRRKIRNWKFKEVCGCKLCYQVFPDHSRYGRFDYEGVRGPRADRQDRCCSNACGYRCGPACIGQSRTGQD